MKTIYYRETGKNSIYNIDIHVNNSTLFIYCSDRLIHLIPLVTNLSTEVLLHIIQMTSDFQFIALPDHDRINIYNLKKLLFYDIIDKKPTTILTTHCITLGGVCYNPTNCTLYEHIYRIDTHDLSILYNLHTLQHTVYSNKIFISPNSRTIAIQDNSKVKLLDKEYTFDEPICCIADNQTIATNKIIILPNQIIGYVEPPDYLYYFKNLIFTDIYISARLLRETDKINWTIFIKLDTYQSFDYQSTIETEKQPEYKYSDGMKLIYRMKDKHVVVLDLFPTIPEKLVEIKIESLRKQINLIPTNRMIKIIAADESVESYHAIFEIFTNSVYEVDVSANVEIYDNTSSFTIFTGLLDQQIKSKDVVQNILKKKFMMYTLTDHLLNYIKHMITSEYLKLYCGYVVMHLLFVYYRISGSIRIDSMHLFKLNYPIFSQDVDYALRIILG